MSIVKASKLGVGVKIGEKHIIGNGGDSSGVNKETVGFLNGHGGGITKTGGKETEGCEKTTAIGPQSQAEVYAALAMRDIGIAV